MFEEELKETGMSNAESKTYITLLKLGNTKSGNIILNSGIQSSVVHNSLNSLIEKGFVKYVLVGKIKQYSAMNPSLILESLDNKKINFERVLPKLLELKNSANIRENESEVYEGFEGLKAAATKLIENSSKKDMIKYFSVNKELSKKEEDFFQKIDLIRIEKGLSVKGIANIEQKENLKNYKNSEIKFTKLSIPPAMNIFQDRILIYSFERKPTATLITSKEIADQYHKLWDSIWEKI